MNCEEFREKMPAEGDKNPELARHLKECKNCQSWLKKELSQPPKGMSEARWKDIEQKLSTPADEAENCKNRTSSMQETAGAPKTLSGSFFHGMTYGLVFGIALVVGLAVVDIQKATSKKSEKPTIQGHSVSNTDKDSSTCPDFNGFDFYPKHLDNRCLSFIDSDKSFNYVLIKRPLENHKTRKYEKTIGR